MNRPNHNPCNCMMRSARGLAAARLRPPWRRSNRRETRGPPQVLEESLGQRRNSGQAVAGIWHTANHVFLKNLGSGVNRRQSEFFFGFEVGVQTAFAHANVFGQVADRQSLEPPCRGQPGGGFQDGPAALDTVTAHSATGRQRGRGGGLDFSAISSAAMLT